MMSIHIISRVVEGFHRFVTAMPYLVRITGHAQKWMGLNPSNVFHHECRNNLKLYYDFVT